MFYKSTVSSMYVIAPEDLPKIVIKHYYSSSSNVSHSSDGGEVGSLNRPRQLIPFSTTESSHGGGWYVGSEP